MTVQVKQKSQVIVCGIVFDPDHGPKVKKIPELLTFDIPDRIQSFEKTNEQKYRDEVETFVYDTLTKRYNSEVQACQIWLPIPEKTVQVTLTNND